MGIVQAVLMVAINLAIAWVMQQIVDIISGKGTSLSLTENIYAAVGILAAIAATMIINYFSVPGFIAKAMAQYKDYAYQALSKKKHFCF